MASARVTIDIPEWIYMLYSLQKSGKKLMFADLYNKYPLGDFYVVNVQENTFIKEDCIWTDLRASINKHSGKILSYSP